MPKVTRGTVACTQSHVPTPFLMRRHRTKLILLEFRQSISHDKLLQKLEPIFKHKIINYLIVTERFIGNDIRTFAFLRFERRVDVYEKSVRFDDNGLLYKGIPHCPGTHIHP